MPVGPRVTAANRLATNVSYWAHLLAKSNSGTACKQWLIADFAKLDQPHKKHEETVKNTHNNEVDNVVDEFSVGGK